MVDEFVVIHLKINTLQSDVKTGISRKIKTRGIEWGQIQSNQDDQDDQMNQTDFFWFRYHLIKSSIYTIFVELLHGSHPEMLPMLPSPLTLWEKQRRPRATGIQHPHNDVGGKINAFLHQYIHIPYHCLPYVHGSCVSTGFPGDNEWFVSQVTWFVSIAKCQESDGKLRSHEDALAVCRAKLWIPLTSLKVAFHSKKW